MSKTADLIENTLVQHTAFDRALGYLNNAFSHASDRSEPNGLAILGESGTGKTSVLDSFAAQHKAYREVDGLRVPVMRVTVPSMPTVKGLAGVMLYALGDSDGDRGTEIQKTKKLRVLLRGTGTKIVIMDEFQHFFDKGQRKIMHHVADWLKVLIDETRCTLVIAGLPVAKVVIDHNEQLGRRFLAPIYMPKFDWNQPDDRNQLKGILHAFHESLSTWFSLPALDSDAMAFRMFCATNGLMSLMSKLLRQAERNVHAEGRRDIQMEDLDLAHLESIWVNDGASDGVRPFDRRFRPEDSMELLMQSRNVGTACQENPKSARGSVKCEKAESLNSLLKKKR